MAPLCGQNVALQCVLARGVQLVKGEKWFSNSAKYPQQQECELWKCYLMWGLGCWAVVVLVVGAGVHEEKSSSNLRDLINLFNSCTAKCTKCVGDCRAFSLMQVSLHV